MRYVDREMRLTASEVRLRYLPYCYVLTDDRTGIISNRDYVPIWIYKKAAEGRVEWIRAARPAAFCSSTRKRSGHFYNPDDLRRASNAAPNPGRDRERHQSAVLDRLVSHVNAAMKRSLRIGLPTGWDCEDRNNKEEAWKRDLEVPLRSNDSYFSLRAKIAPDGLEPVGASPDEILLGTKCVPRPERNDFSRRWWQVQRSIAEDSIPYWEWVVTLKPMGKRLIYDYFLQDTKYEFYYNGPWSCCTKIEQADSDFRAIWRELRGKYIAQGGNFDAWYSQPGEDFRNKLTGVMRVCSKCIHASDLAAGNGVHKARVPWKDHAIQCVVCKNWVCVDHALFCGPSMTYRDRDADTERRKYCGRAFCEDCIDGHKCEYFKQGIYLDSSRQLQTEITSQGHFYLLQTIPEIYPKRIKTGYTARHPFARVVEYCRTGNPTCKLIAVWKCESRSGERAAREVLFHGISGVRHVKGEVYDVDDISDLIDRAIKYFGHEPVST